MWELEGKALKVFIFFRKAVRFMEQDERQNEYFRGTPPNDITAEQAVLGSMFLDREAASTALEILSGADFYRPDHRMVFEAAAELYHTGAPIDVITVKNKLEEKGVFEQIGGLPFLATEIGRAHV